MTLRNLTMHRTATARWTPALVAATLTLATGCVEDLDPIHDTGTDDDTAVVDDRDDTGGSGDDDTGGDTGFGEDLGDGSLQATVDATDAERWVHLDLVGNALVDEAGPWTLKVQRFKLAINGGVSGDGGLEAAFVETAFDDEPTPPRSGWTTDAPDADDDGEPELALDWFDYDPSTHTLSPKSGTWFLRGGDGPTIALEVLGYYDEAGNSGFPTLRWRVVDDGGDEEPPGLGTDEGDGVLGAQIDASQSETWVHVDLEGNALVDETGPWTLKLQRFNIGLNGGVSGDGGLEAAFVEAPFADAPAPPAEGWATDATDPEDEASTAYAIAWYDYDFRTHTVSPKAGTWFVRDADGPFVAFEVVDYYDAEGNGGFPTLRWRLLTP